MDALETLVTQTISVPSGYSVISSSMAWLDDSHVAVAISSYSSGDAIQYIKIYYIATADGNFAITEVSSLAWLTTSDNTSFRGNKLIKLDDGKLALVTIKDYQHNRDYLFVHGFTYNTSTWAVTQGVYLSIYDVTQGHATEDIDVDFFVYSSFFILMISYGNNVEGGIFLTTVSTNVTSSITEIETLTVSSTDKARITTIKYVDYYSFLLTWSYLDSSNIGYVSSQMFTCNYTGQSIASAGSKVNFSISPLSGVIDPTSLSIAKTTSEYNYLVVAGKVDSLDTYLNPAVVMRTVTVDSGANSVSYDSNLASLSGYKYSRAARLDDYNYVLATTDDGYNRVVLVYLISGVITTSPHVYNPGTQNYSNYYQALGVANNDLILYTRYNNVISLLGPIMPKIQVNSTWKRARGFKIRVDGAWEDVADLKIHSNSNWEDIFTG